MGRRKIEIKPIRDDRNRSVTFLKRKGGLFKKAHELSVLCSVDVAVIIFGHNKKLYEYSSGDINETVQRFHYYSGAHEHKGPTDFADKGGGDDEEDEEGGEEGEERETPAPDQPMMGMQHHPGFQHVRGGTPQGSPPMHNGGMPQFQRGPSPLPPGISRPASRQADHQGHMRRTSSNLVPPHQQQQHAGGPMPPQPNYAYTPNPPFYNPQAAAQMQRPPGQPVSGPPPQHPTYPPPPQHASYPPPYPPPNHPQMQQVMMQDNRRSSMPPGYPQQQAPPQANMQRHPSQEHLQPPQHPPPHPSPRPQQQPGRPSPSPRPQQQQFASPPIPQPKPLPAHQKSHSIFTPIDDSRSMLAAAWGSSNNAEPPRSDTQVKIESGGPRSQSIDVAGLQREKDVAGLRPNGVSPRPSPGRAPQRSPQPVQRTESVPAVPNVRAPTRQNTNQSDAKRPRLKVQIPSEQSGDEGGTAESGPEDTSVSGPGNTATGQQQHHMPSHGVVLPPPSPSAGALLSAGAQGPPNPFARPAPPMSTNPHAINREAPMNQQNNIETPISALPSRFMSDNLLPSPSTFYPEWGFGRPADANMLPSPLNFQTPVVANGQGWIRSEEDRKRANDEEGGGDVKKQRL
ncbi:resistance to lethality of mkk1p386 overexpression [Saxophila tyrrhenica]|uniref:Resistance to lethality of mkk1p386 overexpression n=1 Tax=Saxophila tyrrhenica TaxID=1690608 RepID=A0AAV9PJI0_9PEZI|nr:resistance to lethality of mkk1p386 overexpression [Saxophila tyrrhenica]